MMTMKQTTPTTKAGGQSNELCVCSDWTLQGFREHDLRGEHLTKKAFQDDLRGNEFVAYAVLTEWMFDRLMSLDGLDRWEQVKKLTSNYRKWRELDDYIEQCGDIIASKMQAAREVEYMA